MIRVNLLPIKQARRRTAGMKQIGVFTVLIVALLLCLGLFWLTFSSQLENRQQLVRRTQAEVEAAKNDVKDAEQLESQRATLAQQLTVLDDLETQRSGPVRVLDELQAILSPPANEEDRFAQLQRNWNVDWDTRRLWVQKFQERDGAFTMSGSAVNADDVAEFLQRLTTARHFYQVELRVVEARNVGSGREAARIVNFDLNGRIRYVVDDTKTEPGQGS